MRNVQKIKWGRTFNVPKDKKPCIEFRILTIGIKQNNSNKGRKTDPISHQLKRAETLK